MSMRYHVQMDIKGCLLHWDDRRNGHAFQRDDGTPMPPAEAKAELLDLLAKGQRYMQMSKDPCDGWTAERGCPGHPVNGSTPLGSEDK